MTSPDSVELSEKLAFLADAASHMDRPAGVEVIQTHFAWVFLSSRFAWKLKKPIRFQQIDFTTLAARHQNCELEVILNRRLAESVYIAAVPLTLQHGQLALDGAGVPVDWLVKMHRLPADRMLDVAAAARAVSTAELSAVVAKLCRYYARAPRAPFTADGFRAHLVRQLQDTGQQLAALLPRTYRKRLDRLLNARITFIENQTPLFDRRIDEGRVVEAHGDLRPEHIYLADNPQIIDCLEFSTELRWLDTAEELAFLMLELERSGHGDLAGRTWRLYQQRADDDLPESMLGFYRAGRALVRALICAWHIPEADSKQAAEHWRQMTCWYLDAGPAAITVDAY